MVEGLKQGETEVVHDVIAAYKQVHPHAQLCCERLIPNLPMVFTEGDLHRGFNQNGIKKDTDLEFRELLRCLIEIGCIGRVTDADSHRRYIVGEFEYTRPGSLFVSGDERLCLHPVFAEVFGCRHSAARKNQLSAGERATVRPIYPVGSDPATEADYRDAF